MEDIVVDVGIIDIADEMDVIPMLHMYNGLD
jgi:hypothetical protein